MTIKDPFAPARSLGGQEGSTVVQTRLPDKVMLQLDEWRRRQLGIPTRGAALRYLVEKGLSATKPKDKK